MVTTVAAVIGVLGAAWGLTRPRLRRAPTWLATVTPLASIIGSGFLVVAPLLAVTAGRWAPLAMAVIVGLAYWVGAAMRRTIADVEPELERVDAPRILVDLDRLSDLLLGFAYVVSVAFYVRLMAAFLLRGIDDGAVASKVLATLVLGSIAAVGWLRGLHGLERVESVAVGVKLSIIAALIAALVTFDVADSSPLTGGYRGAGFAQNAWESARLLGGMLLVVQGFETSRYLGAHYDRETRIRSMRTAQVLAAGIYVAFVALSVGLVDSPDGPVDETAILDVAELISPVLVPLLLIAAVASQLSAAVADTAGGGEMLSGAARTTQRAGIGHVAVAGAAIAVVWAVDVFAIISLASRAFATYYFVQTWSVVVVLSRRGGSTRDWVTVGCYASLLVVLGFVMIFAIPADG